MKYRDEDIDKLLEIVRIEDVVGEVVELKRSGANYKGLCPFHSDSSPSFMVSPQKNISKCFVCGSGGNPITFYMKYHKVDFATAVKDLAEKFNVGIKVQNSFSKKRDEKNQRLFKLMDEAEEFFAAKIFSPEGKDAFEYLSSRGFKAEFIKNNNIGYAPNSWDDLINYLVSKEYSIEEVEAVGLGKKGDKGYYNTFRNRVMFPIKQVNGQTIAFGGRTLEEGNKVAKYLNSPETAIFNKRRTLYGIKDRGSIIRKKSYVMLMEGYMDVMKAQSYGFDVALASLGTAFTSEQAELLKRYTSNVIIAYDMDSAGRKAVEKTSIILKEYGFNIRVLEFGDAKDPDEYLSNFGRDKFLERVKESKEVFDFLYAYYAKDYDLSDLLAKQNFITAFKEFFVSIESDLEKSLYIDKLSQNLGVDKDLLYDELIRNNKKVVKKIFVPKEKKQKPYIEKKEVMNRLEEESLKLLLADLNFAGFLNEKDIKSGLLKKVLELSSGETRVKSSKELIESDMLEEDEKQRLFDYLALILTMDQKAIEALYIELFVSWFRLELSGKMQETKKKKKMLEMLQLKRIEDNLNKDIYNNEYVKNLYKEFKNFI